MKQFNLFKKNVDESQNGKKYSSKIQALNYEPKNKKPHILELCNKEKTQRLMRRIHDSDLPTEEKSFLIDAARWHNVFDYEKIAELLFAKWYNCRIWSTFLFFAILTFLFW